MDVYVFNKVFIAFQLLNLFIWAVVVIGMVACVFTGNTVAYNYDRLGTAFYLAIHRPAWCVGLAWVIFACMKGRGGKYFCF